MTGESALVALVDSLAEGELGFHAPAARTSLGRRVPPVREHQSAAVPDRLIFNHSTKLTETSVKNRHRKVVISRHSVYIQILKDYRSISLRKRIGELVKPVSSNA